MSLLDDAFWEALDVARDNEHVAFLILKTTLAHFSVPIGFLDSEPPNRAGIDSSRAGAEMTPDARFGESFACL